MRILINGKNHYKGKNYLIENNKIKETGLFAKVIYVIKGSKIVEPGLFGKTVYEIGNNKIKMYGYKGKVVYIIDGNEIKDPNNRGKTAFNITGDISEYLNSKQITTVKPKKKDDFLYSSKNEKEYKEWFSKQTEEKRISEKDRILKELNKDLKKAEKRINKRK